MKKKDNKKQNREPSELKSLNSQLGSFGLEPPKIYRPEQREKMQEARHTVRKKVKQGNKKKTKQTSLKVQNKKRQQKKVLRRVISAICIVLAICVVLVVLSLTVLFKIETITVKGSQYYSNEQVLSVLPIEKGKNLFLCDTDYASEKLEQKLPYIHNVKITRKLPSTVVVTVTETNRVYSIKNSDKTYTLLDGDFKVLEANLSDKPSGCINIKKVALSSAVIGEKAVFTDDSILSDLSVMTATIEKLKLDEVTAIYSSDVNNNYIVYDGRLTIKIGSTDSIEDKIYSALTVIEKLNESNPDAVGEITSNGGKQIYFTEKN